MHDFFTLNRKVGDYYYKLLFDMKYHIFQVFKTSIEFIKKSSYHFKDMYKLKLLTSFDVNMT